MALEIPFIGGANSGATFSPTADVLSGFSVSDLAGDLGEGLGIGLFKPPRKIGTVVPECVVEEQARDDLEITRHPIETGAPITDHAFKMPSEVVVRAGWSDSGSLPGYSKRAYEALLALQLTRTPFSLITGKKTYANMLIASISQATEARTEHALMATVVCRQVFIVQTQTTTVAARENQTAPQSTAATQDSGTRQTEQVSTTTTDTSSNRTILGRASDVVTSARNAISGLLGTGSSQPSSSTFIGG